MDHKTSLSHRLGRLRTLASRRAVVATALLGAALIPGGIMAAFAQQRIAPPAALAAKGTITYCATIDNPPRAFHDTQQRPTGFEVELGTEIAARMGLRVNWVQLKFVGLVPALQARQCDALMQELFIRPERLEVIDMIPFSRTGQRIVTTKTSTLRASSLDDLSGRKMAVPNGTTIHTLALEANARLKAAGRPEINLVVLPTTTETFQQLATGQIEVLGTTTTAASYYIGLRPNDFRPEGNPFGLILTGIGLQKGNGELGEAMKRSFEAIVTDGTYRKLIEKWNMQGSEL
ncbi:ABC transporter substrate-binding protein [Phreatobacter stygius]|uniref:ABC transporter substrate-binding protein n=1 Tax=Phreatobacter stygius TaxID=1940610 RepID=A0A4D7B805_9HYPH|nr:ABC transporter substrate-binding protein [Phreatobacter stygius]QCI67105.1 ABC transporter substrate-binding protein [Phreatobacter stygius]